MKKLIFVVGILFYGITVLNAQERCDTLKIKCIMSDYSKSINDDDIRKLDGAVINIDSFPSILLGVGTVNVSNDTFLRDNQLNYLLLLFIYVDTGRVAVSSDHHAFRFGENFFPNDTFFSYIGLIIDFDDLLISLEEKYGVTIDKITYLQTIIFVNHTDKDGLYSERVFWEGADTATFRITRNEVGIENLVTAQKDISVFPNPAQSQITVTNTQDAVLRLYNVLGQEVVCMSNGDENTIINTSHLPQGLYVLKVEKEKEILTRKVQIMR